MGERLSGLLLLGLVLWTGLGLAGLAVARFRGERRRFRRGATTLGAIWLGYLVILAAVSLKQPARIYGLGQAAGQERCFGTMCFAVTGAEEPEGFWVRGQERERLLRVIVRVTNRDHEHSGHEEGLAAYLMDAQGRRWEPLRGLSGVRLTTTVAAGGVILSEPVFQVGKDSTGLRLVLAHTSWTWARLKIGDAESYFHPAAAMVIPEERK